MMNKILLFYIITVCFSAVGIYGGVYDRPEGSNCSWNGLIGKCTIIYNCTSALDAIRRNISPPICGYQEVLPIVCCTIISTCLLNQSTADEFKGVEKRSRLTQNGTKARDRCLNYVNNFVYYPCPPLRETRLLENNYDHKIPPSSVDPANSHSLECSTRREKRHVKDQTRHFPTIPPMSEQQIYRGTVAYRNQYPHMALLGYGDDVKRAQWLCGGSVISETYILTAAHCSLSAVVGPVKFVALGILKRSDSSEYWQILNVKRVITHPEYQPPSKYNDIALLETEKTIMLKLPRFCSASGMFTQARTDCFQAIIRKKVASLVRRIRGSENSILKVVAEDPRAPVLRHLMRNHCPHEMPRKINFSTHVLPACLPLVPDPHEIAEATGWGALGHRQGLADTLQTVKLKRYDEETCSQLYPKHRHLRRGYDPSSQMCYGDREDPKDTCEGDSGGPLQVKNEFLRCAYTVIGVTSYGRQCGVSTSSGMYTRVYHYVPWIESVVWP